MSWDFETDPEFQAKLDWADVFVREEVEPLDVVWPDLVLGSSVLGLVDGPTEHLPNRIAAAREKFADYLENEVGNL